MTDSEGKTKKRYLKKNAHNIQYFFDALNEFDDLNTSPPFG
jgi:hypothetical protein